MAAVTVVKARPCTPVGYEVNDKCVLSGAVTAGDCLKFTGAVSNGLPVMAKATGGATEVDGIALTDGYDGQAGYSYGLQGEMDGFSGMTPGTAIYPAPSTAGGWDTSAAGAIRAKAITATRIRYNLV